MHRLVKILSESRIVDTIISVDSDAYGEFHKIKIHAHLINGWKLHVWEHVTPSIRRYAYHVSKGAELVSDGIMRRITGKSRLFRIINISRKRFLNRRR